MSEEQKKEIIDFFQGVVVNGIERDVFFSDDAEEGYIQVELRAPAHLGMEPVHLTIPEK